MMTFAVNILVTPKSSDMYDAVAVNDAPILIRCSSEERLCEILNTSKTIEDAFDREVVTNTLKKTARFCYRSLEKPDEVKILPCNFSKNVE